MRKTYFPLITAAWLALTIVMMGLTLLSDYNRLNKNLTSDAHYVYSSAYEKTHINEVLLQNFTALVSANPLDQAVIRSFASDMRKHYPHIIRLQILQQQPISPTDSAYFTGTAFNSDNNETQPLPFPIIFIEPLSPDTRYLLGDDLQLNPTFDETIKYARKYHQPVASPPFALTNQRTGYSLFLAFYDRNTPPDEGNLYIASLVIDIASLLPSSSFLNQGASVTLTSEQGEILDQRFSPDQDKRTGQWLPLLKQQHTINTFGQSFQLEISQQVTLKNLNLTLLITILFSSFAVYLLLMAYLRQRLSVEDEHSNIYNKLKIERQQLEQRIHTRTQELSDQLIENRRLTHQVLAVQEKERRNLSRELHDELGQSLTAIRTDAKILKRIHPEESSIVNQTADSIDAIAQNIYDVTYGMMRTLRPSALDDLGLMDAIQECIVSNRFEEHSITLHTDFRGALNEMSEDYNITLFRLTQESFSNIIKYARAKNVWIDIHRTQSGQRKEISGDRIELMISDDGIGFNIEQEAFKSGFGLIGMRERVRALGGTFQIRRNHESGTRIVAIIPIAPEHSKELAGVAIADQEVPVGHGH
ncbi:ATP-binding protein [Amphritea sp. HPY]|uniref:ATP-binding protein n=1 Tax=Amphritea sp. HPY TaxID=3421652 RepID=UPI003D7DC8F0